MERRACCVEAIYWVYREREGGGSIMSGMVCGHPSFDAMCVCVRVLRVSRAPCACFRLAVEGLTNIMSVCWADQVHVCECVFI